MLVNLSVVGNAVLFVLLVGGSHPQPDSSAYPQIHPHKPVHIARTLDVLTAARFQTAVIDGSAAWDAAVGSNIIDNYGVFDNQQIDAIIVDSPENGSTQVTHVPHNTKNQPWTFNVTYVTSECGNIACAYTIGLDPTGDPFKVVVLNQDYGTPNMSGRMTTRSLTHELGHVLGLDDHDYDDDDYEPYPGMMDSTCAISGCEDDPADYTIISLPQSLLNAAPILNYFADEGSCVRKLFQISGRQLCGH